MSLSTLQPQATLIKFPGYYEFRASCSRQCFSIPESIIYYISKNPLSSKIYQKMIKCCKFFFIKNPIIIFHCLNFEENLWKTCVNRSCRERLENQKYPQITLDLEKIIQSKIGINKRFKISSLNSNIASSIIPKLYNGNFRMLKLDGQIISLNDLLFFSTKVKKLYFDESNVFYENGDEVPNEVILTHFPNADCLYFKHEKQFYDFTNTVKELLKVSHFKNLKAFVGFGLRESFDIVTFFEYLKKNTQTKISLKFSEPLSDEYKDKLEEIVDEILFAESPRSYIPPFILFPGQLRSKNRALFNLCISYD